MSRAVTAFVIEDDGSVTFCAADGTQVTLSAGGGSQPGAPVYRRLPFAFDTAGLDGGVELYTPTVGDLLLDLWFEIDAAWVAGNPAFGDVVVGSNTDGLFKTIGNSNQSQTGLAGINMKIRDNTGWYGPLSSGNTLNQLLAAMMMVNAGNGGLLIASAEDQIVRTNAANTAPLWSSGDRIIPAKFTTADPVKVVVSQDGTVGGGDPAASAGAASLILVTVTPVSS